jgi:hypothetical protein
MISGVGGPDGLTRHALIRNRHPAGMPDAVYVTLYGTPTFIVGGLPADWIETDHSTLHDAAGLTVNSQRGG